MRAWLKFKKGDPEAERPITVGDAAQLIFCVYFDVLDRLRRARGMGEPEARDKSLREAFEMLTRILPKLKYTWQVVPPPHE